MNYIRNFVNYGKSIAFYSVLLIIAAFLFGCGGGGSDINDSDSKYNQYSGNEDFVITEKANIVEKVNNDGSYYQQLIAYNSSDNSNVTASIKAAANTFDQDTTIEFQQQTFSDFENKTGDTSNIYKKAKSPVYNIKATNNNKYYKNLNKPLTLKLPVNSFTPVNSSRAAFDISGLILGMKDSTDNNAPWQYLNICQSAFNIVGSSTVTAYTEGNFVIIETQIICCYFVVLSVNDIVQEKQDFYCGNLKNLETVAVPEKIEYIRSQDGTLTYSENVEVLATVEAEQAQIFNKGNISAEISFYSDYSRSYGVINVNGASIVDLVGIQEASGKYKHILNIKNLSISDAVSSAGTKSTFRFYIGIKGLPNTEFPEEFTVKITMTVGFGADSYETCAEAIVKREVVTNTDTNTATGTATITATDTYIITDTNTATGTETITATDTWTITDTNTATGTETITATDTYTITDTNTATGTATITATDTYTITDTNTATGTETITATDTWTITDTGTSTDTITSTGTETATNTATGTDTEVTDNRPKLPDSIIASVRNDHNGIYITFSDDIDFKFENNTIASLTMSDSEGKPIYSIYSSNDNEVYTYRYEPINNELHIYQYYQYVQFSGYNLGLKNGEKFILDFAEGIKSKDGNVEYKATRKEVTASLIEAALISPASGSVNVELDTDIVFTFSKPLNLSDHISLEIDYLDLPRIIIWNRDFEYYYPKHIITATFTYDSIANKLTVTPEELLDGETMYYIDMVNISDCVTGEYVENIASATFWTKVDESQIHSSLVSPVTDSTEVETDAQIVIGFDKPLNLADGDVLQDLENSSLPIYLKEAYYDEYSSEWHYSEWQSVQCDFKYDSNNNRITIIPRNNLKSNTDYSLVINDKEKVLANNRVKQAKYHFKTKNQ